MAIAEDVRNLGENALDSAQTSIAFTTGTAVASGGFIVVTITCLSVRTVTGISGGSLTWVKDKEGSNNSTISIWSAQAPAGLASGTTITATFSASSAGGNSICGTSYTGVATSSPVDTTNGPQAAVGTAWATGSMTIAAGSVIVACASDFNTLQTSTPTAPSVEAHDFGAGGFSQTTCYRIEAAGGSFTVAGTWAATTLNNGDIDAVAYKAAADAAGSAGPNRPMVMRLMGTPVQRFCAFPQPDITFLAPAADVLPPWPTVVDTAVNQAANN